MDSFFISPILFLDEDLQEKFRQPLDIHDFFLIPELHYNGLQLTSEQKEVNVNCCN